MNQKTVRFDLNNITYIDQISTKLDNKDNILKSKLNFVNNKIQLEHKMTSKIFLFVSKLFNFF